MTSKKYIAVKYTVQTEIARSPEDVFAHLIDLEKWWPERFEGDRLQLNTEFVMTTGDNHYSKNKVIEFVPNKKVTWVATEAIRKTDNYDWTGSKFIFELTPAGTNTRLSFTYDGVVFEDEQDALKKICDITINQLFHNYITGAEDKKANTDFTATIELEKPVHDVFKALTNDVAKWWGGKDLSGSSAKLNDEFVIHHAGAHYSKQKVVDLIPDQKVVWLVTESDLSWLKEDKQEWTNTKMIFELHAKDGKTALQFTHVGLTPDKECYETCAHKGWSVIIKDYLFHYLAEGKPHF